MYISDNNVNHTNSELQFFIMDKKYTAKSIDVSNSEQVFHIKWADGHETEFSLFGLRKNCPCVECRGGHDKMGKYEVELFKVNPTREFKILKAEPVGNHALKIHWDDGHNTGMYQWQLLRAMSEALEKNND